MINLEQQHPREPHWLYWLGNATAIDDTWIKSIGIAWLFKDKVPLHRGFRSDLFEPAPLGIKWIFTPRITGEQSLFFNAVFFFRLCWRPGVFFSFRWSGSSTKKALFQCGIGWKLNGRFAFILRIQSDETSAAGSSSPNTGQATGFNYGTH